MRRARSRVLFRASSGHGLDRSAIAKPLPLDRAALPAAARERVGWMGVATTVIDTEVPERISPAQREKHQP